MAQNALAAPTQKLGCQAPGRPERMETSRMQGEGDDGTIAPAYQSRPAAGGVDRTIVGSTDCEYQFLE